VHHPSLHQPSRLNDVQAAGHGTLFACSPVQLMHAWDVVPGGLENDAAAADDVMYPLPGQPPAQERQGWQAQCCTSFSNIPCMCKRASSGIRSKAIEPKRSSIQAMPRKGIHP
jgi:hypothetical protein